jgi:hypothetical protein
LAPELRRGEKTFVVGVSNIQCGFVGANQSGNQSGVMSTSPVMDVQRHVLQCILGRPIFAFRKYCTSTSWRHFWHEGSSALSTHSGNRCWPPSEDTDGTGSIDQDRWTDAASPRYQPVPHVSCVEHSGVGSQSKNMLVACGAGVVGMTPPTTPTLEILREYRALSDDSRAAGCSCHGARSLLALETHAPIEAVLPRLRWSRPSAAISGFAPAAPPGERPGDSLHNWS